MASKTSLYTGIIVEEEFELTLGDLSRACAMDAEWLIKLVEEGVLEPLHTSPDKWRFSGISLQRARRVRRLQSDLGINLAGAALALELLDEIENLRSRLATLESLMEE